VSTLLGNVCLTSRLNLGASFRAVQKPALWTGSIRAAPRARLAMLVHARHELSSVAQPMPSDDKASVA